MRLPAGKGPPPPRQGTARPDAPASRAGKPALPPGHVPRPRHATAVIRNARSSVSPASNQGIAMLRPLLLAATFALPAPALAGAEEFKAVHDRQTFLALVQGRDLSLPLFRIRLTVRPDGRIEGSALGWGVTGTWSWKDGYFCREMDWSGKPIPWNCQLVEERAGRELRFTVDRGEGESARFKLD